MTHPVDFPQEFPRWELEMPPLPEVELPKLPPVPQGGFLAFAMQQYAVEYAEKFAAVYGELCARMAREQERERCIQACKGEEVDADGSQHREDVAYNTAIEHCIEAIRKG